jgi:hypothetical protein
MAVGSKMDTYANLCIVTVAEPAINTLTFKKIDAQISFNQKVAWIISRVEYFVSSLAAATFNGDSDALHFGLSCANSWVAPTLEEITILDFNWVQRLDYGAAAAQERSHMPILKDFSNLPGGGMLVPPAPLFGFLKGNGLAVVTTMTARIYYTVLDLSPDDFWQLVETRRVLVS